MRVKSVILIISFILICLLNFSQVFASVVQIPNSNKNTDHMEVIDTNTGYSLPNTGVSNNSNFLLVTIVLILIGTVYSYKKIKDYRDI